MAFRISWFALAPFALRWFFLRTLTGPRGSFLWIAVEKYAVRVSSFFFFACCTLEPVS